MKPVLIRFDSAVLTELTTLAERNGMSLASLVRQIITEWFQYRRTIDTNPKP